MGMSQWMIWTLVALVCVPQLLQLGLMYAPRSFWRGLATEHRKAAHFLWGFSHLLGPLSKPGEPPAWERMSR